MSSRTGGVCSDSASRALSSEEAKRLAEETAPKYKEAPGLVCKYFVQGEDGLAWGGIYPWETQALFDEERQDSSERCTGAHRQ